MALWHSMMFSRSATATRPQFPLIWAGFSAGAPIWSICVTSWSTTSAQGRRQVSLMLIVANCGAEVTVGFLRDVVQGGWWHFLSLGSRLPREESLPSDPAECQGSPMKVATSERPVIGWFAGLLALDAIFYKGSNCRNVSISYRQTCWSGLAILYRVKKRQKKV